MAKIHEPISLKIELDSGLVISVDDQGVHLPDVTIPIAEWQSLTEALRQSRAFASLASTRAQDVETRPGSEGRTRRTDTDIEAQAEAIVAELRGGAYVRRTRDTTTAVKRLIAAGRVAITGSGQVVLVDTPST